MFNHRKIKISKSLYENLATAAQEAGYASTDEFIQHVLERSIEGKQELSDQEQAERQLRGLGYLE
jgi:metal-responsive CopG/Arc/MetJ family transcriptional regulator